MHQVGLGALAIPDIHETALARNKAGKSA